LQDAIFTADDQAIKLVSWGREDIVESFSLAPDTRPARQLLLLAELLSLRCLDPSGTLVPIDLEALTNTSWSLTQPSFGIEPEAIKPSRAASTAPDR
jgi:hypothetical protein